MRQTEQVGWRQRLPLDENFLRSCGYHTVDISPCSDGRLQGVGAYVLRYSAGPNVRVKAYAGALFDVEARCIRLGAARSRATVGRYGRW